MEEDESLKGLQSSQQAEAVPAAEKGKSFEEIEPQNARTKAVEEYFTPNECTKCLPRYQYAPTLPCVGVESGIWSRVKKCLSGTALQSRNFRMEYPLYAIKLSTLLKLTQMVPHEQLMEAGTLERYTPSLGPLIFVSHQWESYAEPDPTGQQFEALRAYMSNSDKLEQLLAGMDRRPQSQQALVQADRHRAAEAARNGGGGSALRRCESAVPGAVDAVYVWLDYWSIPQANRERQGRAIRSILAYVGMASMLCVLVASGTHKETGEACNLQSWVSRGWCRLEKQAFVFKDYKVGRAPRIHFCFAGSGRADGGPDGYPDAMRLINTTRDARSSVFLGNFTCCARNHVDGCGGRMRCDRQLLKPLVLAMHAHACEEALLHGDMTTWRRLVSTRWMVVAGAENGGQGDGDHTAADEAVAADAAEAAARASTKATGDIRRAQLRPQGHAQAYSHTPSHGQEAATALNIAAPRASDTSVPAASTLTVPTAKCRAFLRTYRIPSANAVVESDMTALHYAAYANDACAVSALVTAGGLVNARDLDGLSPLHLACTCGNTKAARALLEAKADIDEKTVSGMTPLHCSLMNGCEEVVKLLIARGADIDARIPPASHIRFTRGFAPLHMAAYNRHASIVRTLLHAAADHTAQVQTDGPLRNCRFDQIAVKRGIAAELADVIDTKVENEGV